MKKLVSLLICLSVLLYVFSAVPYALDIPAGTGYLDGQDALHFPEDPIPVSGIISPRKFYSNGSNSHLFYNQLDAAQKVVYDSIVAQKAGLNNSGSVTVNFGQSCWASSSSGLNDSLNSALIGGISAVMDDYPEYFWIGGFGGSSYSYNYSGGKYYIPSYTFPFSEGVYDTDSYSSFSEVVSSYNQMMNIVSSLEVNGFNRYEKVKSIHDWISNNAEYDDSYNAPMAHHPTGIFLNGLAVCEGYAEAFKLLCDREGIPCVIVSGLGNGGAHEWNYVQMEDGKWYGLDVTWDDQTTSQYSPGIYYDYFLTGSSTKTSTGWGGDAWSVSHVAQGTHFDGYSFVLSYPILATTSYSAIMPLFNADVTFDAVNNLLFIGKGSSLKNEFWKTSGYASYAPSDNAATVSGNTTGATVTITSPVNRTYTVVRWGDVNADNNVNATDKNIIRNAALCQSTISGTANNAAADFNHDGVVDGFDAVYMELYLNNAVSK
ncbi:MAG: hypothetical protein K5761_00030 [Clostridiales bacterium]|nr:hypothetical protein [Clostridiales bacterium]